MVKPGANVVNVALGTMSVYWSARPSAHIMPFLIPYNSISLSLNVLLTLMIVVRLILHARDTRTILGKTGIGGLYKAVVTILAESCALYAVNSLVYLGLLGAGNLVVYVFSPTLSQTQVCAFYDPTFGPTSDTTMDRTGDRSAAHHSAGRQQDRVDEQHFCFCAYQ